MATVPTILLSDALEELGVLPFGRSPMLQINAPGRTLTYADGFGGSIVNIGQSTPVTLLVPRRSVAVTMGGVVIPPIGNGYTFDPTNPFPLTFTFERLGSGPIIVNAATGVVIKWGRLLPNGQYELDPQYMDRWGSSITIKDKGNDEAGNEVWGTW